MNWLRQLTPVALALALCVVFADQRIYAQDTPKNNDDKKGGNNSALRSPDSRDQRRGVQLGEEVRHQLVTLPYYSVFDWLEASVTAQGEVALMGEVVRPTTKSDAENRIKQLEGVSRVENKIEVLPLSPNDNELRIALYRSIFNYNSPLFRYGTAAIPSIHIIVSNGHVALKGVVASAEDAQLANTAANQVPGVFEVKNELQVEKPVAGNSDRLPAERASETAAYRR
jgi:hyperosmotically inducible periplasmic protein